MQIVTLEKEKILQKNLNKKTGSKPDLTSFRIQKWLLDSNISYLHSFLLFACWLFLNLIQQGFSLIQPSTYVGNIFIKYFQLALMILEKDRGGGGGGVGRVSMW